MMTMTFGGAAATGTASRTRTTTGTTTDMPARVNIGHSVSDRAVDLHLHGAFGQPFLLAALAVGGQVRRLAVKVEGGVVLVLLVEEKEIRILRGAVRPIDEAARLRLAHGRHLLLEQRGQRVALALCRPKLRHHRQHVCHDWSSSWSRGSQSKSRHGTALFSSTLGPGRPARWLAASSSLP